MLEVTRYCSWSNWARYMHTILLIDDDRMHRPHSTISKPVFVPLQWLWHLVPLACRRANIRASFFRLPVDSATSLQILPILRQQFRMFPSFYRPEPQSMPAEMVSLVDGFINKSDPKEMLRFATEFLLGGEQRL